jgi:chromosome condensin MukBEF ATPase and DNA-binding subunit MukB
MNILTSWEKRRAKKRAERRAKARSDEIDRQLMEERRRHKQQHDILLIGSCFDFFFSRIWLSYSKG